MSNNCIGCPMHLSVCKAECCSEFRLKTDMRQHLKKGDVIRIQNTDDDLELYYNLHGCKSDKDYVYIVIKAFRRIGRFVYVEARCSLLTDDLLCKGHNGEVKRPKLCDYPNIKEGSGGKSIYITNNCLFEVNGGIREKWKNKMSQ